MSSTTLPAAGATRSGTALASAASSAVVPAAVVNDEAERAVLCLKLNDVQCEVSRQQRSIARLRSKLFGLADRKTPLIAALQSELASQHSHISQLRAHLAEQRTSFTADEEAAHAVYESALRSIEANSRSALSAAASEVASLLDSSNELASFELVEAALHLKCTHLARKNADNETKHRQRLADMRRQWDISRAQLHEAASRARHDSERRYKQQVMAAINISYDTMSDEIRTMQHNKQAEVRQLGGLHDAIQRCRRLIEDEKERERSEQQRTADSQRSLLDVRLQLRQVRRDTVHEQTKLSSHTWQSAQRRQQRRAERQLRRERLESDLQGWHSVRCAFERSVRRVAEVVAEVDRARDGNSFQQLVEECIDDGRTATHKSSHRPAVHAMSEEERQRMLRLLFARIRQAETECVQRQQQPTEQQPLIDGAVGVDSILRAVHEMDLEQDGSESWHAAGVAHSGPSFFLTQYQQADEAEQLDDITGNSGGA